jgi:parallel beta-helix repeat protein
MDMRSLLSLNLVLACLLLLANLAVAAETPLQFSGVQSTDLVWSGTVIMSGDVLIPAGTKLTIAAGTEVRVTPAEATKIDPEYLSSQTELLIRGQLEARGTQERPIRFVLVGEPKEEIAWAGLILDGSAESILRHLVLERADIGIRCVNTSPLIEGCHISRCRYGIVAQQQSHPKILNNLIEKGEGGLFCWRGSNPYLKGNRIIDNDEEGLFVDASSRPWIDRNHLSGNAIGLALYPRDLPYDETEVYDNGENVRWLGKQGQDKVRL